MNTKKIKIFILSLLLFITSFVPNNYILAGSEVAKGLKTTGGEANVTTNVNLYGYLALIIQTILGAIGIVILILIVYAGVLYLTASGNSEKIKKANGILFSAVLGLIVIFGAYSISAYVVNRLSSGLIS